MLFPQYQELGGVSLASNGTEDTTTHTLIGDVVDNFGTTLCNLSVGDSHITMPTTKASAVSTSFADATNGTRAADEQYIIPYCHTKEGMQKCTLLLQITYGVIYPMICVIGLIGNALNLPVVIKRSRNAQMYRYLTWMSVSDICTTIFALILGVMLGWTTPASYSEAFFVIQVEYYLINVFLVSSTLLVVTITVERFAAVAVPLRAKTLFTRRSSYIFICLAYVLPLLFFTADWFSKEVETVFDYHSMRFFYFEISTEFASSDEYKAIVWLRVSLFKFLTIIIIVIMNTATIIVYNVSMKRRKALVSSGGQRGPADRAADSRDRELMALLITVVVIYVICVTPIAIQFLMEVMLGVDYMTMYFSYQVFSAVANTLEVMNSAVNFYFYCLSSRDYRKGFRSIIVSPIVTWASKHCGCFKRDRPAATHRRMLPQSTSQTTSMSTYYSHQTSCVSEPLVQGEAVEPSAAVAPLEQLVNLK